MSLLLSAVLALCPSPAPVVVQGLELLENGGFEDDLAGWRSLNMSGATTFTPDRKNVATGRKSLRIERTGNPGRIDFLKQSADLGGARGRVDARISYRLNKDAAVSVDVYFFDGAGKTIGGYHTLAQGKFKSYQFDTSEAQYEIPAGAAGVGVNVRVSSTGTLWVDDVSLTLHAEATNAGAGEGSRPALANGGFDENLDGWAELPNGSKRFLCKIDKKVHAAGGGALRLERRTPRLFPEDGVRTEVRGITAGGTLRLSLAARTEGDARAYACLVALDGRAAPLASERVRLGGASFGRGALELELPPGTERVAVVLTIGGGGVVWFDDVVLEEA